MIVIHKKYTEIDNLFYSYKLLLQLIWNFPCMTWRLFSMQHNFKRTLETIEEILQEKFRDISQTLPG